MRYLIRLGISCLSDSSPIRIMGSFSMPDYILLQYGSVEEEDYELFHCGNEINL